MAPRARVALVVAVVVVVVFGVGANVGQPPRCAEYPVACKAVGEVMDRSLGICGYMPDNYITVGTLCVPAPANKPFRLQMFLELIQSSWFQGKESVDHLQLFVNGDGNATLRYKGKGLRKPVAHLLPESLPLQWIHLTLVIHEGVLHLYRRDIPWEGVRWTLPPSSAFAKITASTFSTTPTGRASETTAADVPSPRLDLVLRVHVDPGTDVTFNCAQGCPRHNSTSSLIGHPFQLQSDTIVLYLLVLKPANFTVILNATGRFETNASASMQSRPVVTVRNPGSSSSSGSPLPLTERKWHELFIRIVKTDGKEILRATLAGHALPPVDMVEASLLRIATMENVHWTLGCNPEIEEKNLLEAQKERWQREEEEERRKEEEKRKEEEEEQEKEEAADASAITSWTLVVVSLIGMGIVGIVICTVLRPYGGVPEEATPRTTPSRTPASLRHGAFHTPSISLGASQQTLFLTAQNYNDAPKVVFSKLREAEEDWDPGAADSLCINPASLEPLSISTSILTSTTTVDVTRDDDNGDNDDVVNNTAPDRKLDTKLKCTSEMEGRR